MSEKTNVCYWFGYDVWTDAGVVSARWDEDGEERHDYAEHEGVCAVENLRLSLAWLEENCGVTTTTSEALSAACEALRQIGQTL